MLGKKRGWLFAGTEDFFFTDFDKDDVGADFADFVPGDDVFLVGAHKTAETGGAGDDDGADKASAFVEDKVADTA